MPCRPRPSPVTELAENPLLEGLRSRRTPEPCALAIFGASGDLTQRKLFPALYALAVRNLLPEQFAVVGVARTPMSTDEFREQMEEAVKEHGRDEFRPDVWGELAEGIRYVCADLVDAQEDQEVVETLNELDESRGTAGNRVYYLAVPPRAIEPIVVQIGPRRATRGWTRLIVEKPFGHDLESARRLNEIVRAYFDESEIFRIDHTHLLQLVALTAMEPPIDFSAESVRNEKVKVLRATHTPGPKHVVRGQYGPGYVDGEEVPGYREEERDDPDFATETYVAAKLYVDNWRWADTPFYLRTGKRLPRRETTIAIQFKRAPHPPFEVDAEEGLRPNVLLVHIQPDEGVSLAIGAKMPGQGLTIRTVHMDFLYGGSFRVGLPEAYERLILDCLLGDATLFTRADEVEEQWALVDAMVAPWKRDRPHFPNYAAGTWGPPAADELLHRDGRSWRRH